MAGGPRWALGVHGWPWPASSLTPWALAPTLATRTTRSTPQGFAATLGGAKERRNRQGFGVLEIRPGASPWS